MDRFGIYPCMNSSAHSQSAHLYNPLQILVHVFKEAYKSAIYAYAPNLRTDLPN